MKRNRQAPAPAIPTQQPPGPTLATTATIWPGHGGVDHQRESALVPYPPGNQAQVELHLLLFLPGQPTLGALRSPPDPDRHPRSGATTVQTGGSAAPRSSAPVPAPRPPTEGNCQPRPETRNPEMPKSPPPYHLKGGTEIFSIFGPDKLSMVRSTPHDGTHAQKFSNRFSAGG
jgi:hypothetical protein